MEKGRREEQARLLELNKRFLEEIESGKGWSDVKHLIEDMKQIAKRLDHLPAQVVSFDNYPLNKTGESQV
jgi:hypothetical protein